MVRMVRKMEHMEVVLRKDVEDVKMVGMLSGNYAHTNVLYLHFR